MHTKFERLLSKSLTTLEVMTHYLVVHTGPDPFLRHCNGYPAMLPTVSVFLACYQCQSAASSLRWDLNFPALVYGISTQVKRRRWRWIGHVLRQQTTALTRIALRWTPDGQRKRGRPKETWRGTVEREMKEKGWTWGRLERVSADRHRWRALVEALCAT